MRRMRTNNCLATALSIATFTMLIAGCRKEADTPMTQTEAHDAMDETTVSSQASSLTTSSIEVGTNFTIGGAVEDAARELKTFVTTQLPCADVTLANATLTIAYGAKSGNCTYNGHTFSGSHTITVSKNDDNDVLVDHVWTDLSNGVVKVSGSAHVTWDLEEKSRHVEHDLTWTRIADGRTGHGTGDRTQTPLSGGLAEGIQVDGSRSWSSNRGTWDLTISGVQMRWADPLPQAGSYRLATPKSRSLELDFDRVDSDTIRVTLKSGDRSFDFNVNSTGNVADE